MSPKPGCPLEPLLEQTYPWASPIPDEISCICYKALWIIGEIVIKDFWISLYFLGFGLKCQKLGSTVRGVTTI